MFYATATEGQVVLRFTTREPFLDYLAQFGHTPAAAVYQESDQ
jgi:hypothetical protein